jgi:beta-xylosidase
MRQDSDRNIQNTQDNLWTPNRGDGTYKNPIIFADYSDPDLIRWGDAFYLTASSFQYTPGLPILKSYNLVDWELIGYALDEIPEDSYDSPRFSCGVWAPAIRVHDDKVWIFYGMPDEGIFAVWATDPEGAWSEPILIKAGKGLIDPCPIWEENGDAYVVHAYAKSRIGFKSVLGIFQFQKNGLPYDGQDKLLFDGHPDQFTIEGPKIYKRNGYYYILAPAGGVVTGWQLAMRSKSLMGPYEIKEVLHQGQSSVNGPHQGGLVEDFADKAYFIHFQDKGAYGRICHLQPVLWKDDWPLMGQNGEPVEGGLIPTGKYDEDRAPLSLQASDSFAGPALGLQWQWSANPPKGAYRLGDEEKPGLELYALNLGSNTSYNLWNRPQVLSQKLLSPEQNFEVSLDGRALAEDNAAGLVILGASYMSVRLEKEKDNCFLSLVRADNMEEETVLERSIWTGSEICFGLDVSPKNQAGEALARFYYRVEGKKTYFDEEEILKSHTWTGARVGIYAISKSLKSQGKALFRDFEVRSLEE